ncbi:hypothetical protein GCM10022225_32710 [Plantactinospora mayteni]|uniref:Uncharacterized protein n=1 Tax=Plantactinospora mayteni TaxID=566021 RepID=A0ABQ4ELJ1_9ACTN|nr:hypothetical protein [Plantactinospora mayteni]GIG95565.1 hypothetical protein Pma05_21380 [Plantactinospora mayteni]
MSIGRLADKVLSLVVPKMSASAAQQTSCMYCSSTYSKRCVRDCIGGVCEPWRCASCGTC